jgi:2-polyprenyl-6-methoxyphenol hydroxylase-like FAD-dependent oxidoreductase
MRVVINGAGIAGPTLAYWLGRTGHDVTLVESAPELRRGGYVVDFWGLGYDVAEKMGVLPRIRELGYQVREVRFVDEAGRRAGGFAVDSFRRATHDRFTSVRRSDISAAIYDALPGSVDAVFGDSVAAIEDTGSGVRVSFDSGASRDVDLVIGADGLHSRVRELVFGPEARFEVSLDYHVAAFEAAGYGPREDLVYVGYSVPGRQLSRLSLRDDRTLFLAVFRNEYLAGTPRTPAEIKAAIRGVFAGVGWESPRILAAMDASENVYFDSVSQIRIDRWTRGRVALAGDAAACVSLMAGEGTGLAMAEAYVLAGELHRAAGDHAAAFRRYEERLMPFLAAKQRAAARFASAFAPSTRAGLLFRNAVTGFFRFAPVADFFVGRSLRDDIALPDYGF